MGDSNVNSYDLQNAQQLLAAITRKQTRRQRESVPPLAHSAYTKLSALTPIRPAGLASGGVESGEPAPDALNEEPPPAFETWDSCIAWCMTLTRAESVFAVNSQGFVIACRGRAPSQGYEGAGAELICSIEQLERIAPDAGKLFSVELEFDKKRLAGFVTVAEEDEFFLVGLISPETLSSQTKQKILRQITLSLPNMD